MKGLARDPADVMVVPDHGHLEVETMGEAIERTAMMMVEMRKLRSEGTVKRNISGGIILWWASFSMFLILMLLHFVLSCAIG